MTCGGDQERKPVVAAARVPSRAVAPAGTARMPWMGAHSCRASFGVCSATSRYRLSMPSSRGTDMTARRDVLQPCAERTPPGAVGSPHLPMRCRRGCWPEGRACSSPQGTVDRVKELRRSVWDRNPHKDILLAQFRGISSPVCAQIYEEVWTRGRAYFRSCFSVRCRNGLSAGF